MKWENEYMMYRLIDEDGMTLAEIDIHALHNKKYRAYVMFDSATCIEVDSGDDLSKIQKYLVEGLS